MVVEEQIETTDDVIGDVAYPADVLKRMQRSDINITGMPIAKEFQVVNLILRLT